MNNNLHFSNKVISLLLDNNIVIDDAIENNIACLESHFAEVEFELKFEITEHCNLNCSFCHQEFGRKRNKKQNFPFESFKEIINRAHNERQIRYIRITGGEPLLHPDVKDFLSYASNTGFKTILNTNAVCLTEELARELAPVVNVWKISLPSVDPKRTEKITESPFAWKQKNNALKILQKMSCTTEILIVLTHENIQKIPNFIAIAKHYGAIPSFLRHESNYHDRMPLTPSDIKLALNLLEHHHLKFGMALPFCVLPGPQKVAKLADGRIVCGPFSSLVVAKNGRVYRCYSRRKLSPMFDGFINTAMTLAAEDFLNLPNPCQKCKFGAQCLGGCGCAFSYRDSPTDRIDYLADFNNISTCGEHGRNAERMLK